MIAFAEGHSHHCACRMVWGDGECECQKKGIIPGPISRLIDLRFRTRITEDGIIVVHRDLPGDHIVTGKECWCDPFMFSADSIKTTEELLKTIEERERKQ